MGDQPRPNSDRDFRRVFYEAKVPSSIARQPLTFQQRLLELAHVQQRQEPLFELNESAESDESLSSVLNDSVANDNVYPNPQPATPPARLEILREVSHNPFPRADYNFDFEESFVAMSARLQDPPVFDPTGTDSAGRWLKTFNRICENNNWDPRKRLKVFPLSVKGRALTWFEAAENRATAESTPENVKELNWAELQTQFLELFDPSYGKNVISRLENRHQRMDEPVAEYVVDKLGLIDEYNAKMSNEERVAWLMKGFRPDLKGGLVGHKYETSQDLTKAAMRLEEIEKEKEEAKRFERLVAPVWVEQQASESLSMQTIMNKLVEMQIQFSELKAKVDHNGREAVNRSVVRDEPYRQSYHRVVCFYCRKEGHVQRDCRRFLSRHGQRNQPFDSRNDRYDRDDRDNRNNNNNNDNGNVQGTPAVPSGN